MDNEIKMCCGTTCQKSVIVKEVAALRAQIAELTFENDQLRSNAITENFAKKCFDAGVAARPSFLHPNVKHWLHFKATEL